MVVYSTFFRNPFLLSIIGIIRDSQNYILILKHTYCQDSWTLPSGWLQKSETPLSALV